MKRGTTENPKFRRPCRRLGLEPWAVVGILEAVWHFTAKVAPAGDIGRWSEEDIADGIDWKSGSASDLTSALVAEGWLEKHHLHRLLVHDWRQHCDDAVRLALARFVAPREHTSLAPADAAGR